MTSNVGPSASGFPRECLSFIFIKTSVTRLAQTLFDIYVSLQMNK